MTRAGDVLTPRFTIECADPALAAHKTSLALAQYLGYEIGKGVEREHDRPDFTGPWRRDDKARCWWRPYRVPLNTDTFVHDSRVIFDDGTFWP